jgi:diguanylate cyclase (GGDEF)-like protein
MAVHAGSAGRWRLPSLTGRATADLAAYSAATGVVIGLAFPVALVELGLEPALAGSAPVRMICVLAGFAVAGANVVLTRLVIGTRLTDLADAMSSTRIAIQASIDSGGDDVSGEGCHVEVDSTDQLGAVAADYNKLVDAVVRANDLQRAVSGLTLAVTSELDVGNLCRAGLSELRVRAGVVAAAVVIRTDGYSRLETSGPVPAEVVEAGRQVADGYAATDRVGRLGWRVVPLAIKDRALGVLLLPEDAQGFERSRVIDVFAGALAVSLSNALAHERLQTVATVDELTGLLNRRAGLQCLSDHVRGSQGSVAVAIIDLDRFKRVNDTYGHLVGDRMLAHVATTCRAAVRTDDVLLRYGGEEFVAVFPGADSTVAVRAAERLRVAVRSSPITLPDGASLAVTVSVGVAVRSAQASVPGEDPVAEVLRRADRALYDAKAAGRDRVVMEPRCEAALASS